MESCKGKQSIRYDAESVSVVTHASCREEDQEEAGRWPNAWKPGHRIARDRATGRSVVLASQDWVRSFTERVLVLWMGPQDMGA